MKWKPEYPGQTEPLWTWWDVGDSEECLVGFHTRDDLDKFNNGVPGPYRRRISPYGKTISQLETWRDMLNRWCNT